MEFQVRSVNISRLLLIGLLFSIVVSGCKEPEEEPTPQDTQKTTGFIITGNTSSDNAVVKYFEEIPTGTVDLSDGTDFVRFLPTAIFNHNIYLTRPDNASGFAKFSIDENGQFVEEGILPTVDQGSFRIAVRDAETGVYQDRATPNIITVFDPTTLGIKGSIDMTAALDPIDSLEQRYQRFIFRGNDVFAPIRANAGDVFNGFYLHQASLSSNSYVGETFVEAPLSGGVLTVNNFGQDLVDSNGDLYVHDGGAIGTATFARVYRIPAGSNEIDPNYVFEPVKVLNPTNIFYPTMNGFKLVGNGKAIAKVNTTTPQAAVDLVTNAGGLQNVLGDQVLLNQILGILFTAESAEWCELDLISQSVTPLAGAPKLGAIATGSVIFEHDGEVYFPIATTAEQAFYKYTPGIPVATKAFDVTGAEVLGGYNIANNN